MANRSERFEVLIDASPEEVWRCLTTADGLASWFGTWAEIDTRIDGDRVIGWGDGFAMTGKVTDLEPGRRLRVVYLAEEDEVGAEEWLIAREGGVTRLTLINSMSDEGVEDWEGFYGDIRRGWKIFMTSLQFALEEAVAPGRTAICEHIPVPGDRAPIWERVHDLVGGSDLTRGMDRRLVDPPHSLLLTQPDRSVLLDLEGAGDGQVLYTQAACHGEPDQRWMDDVLALVRG